MAGATGLPPSQASSLGSSQIKGGEGGGSCSTAGPGPVRGHSCALLDWDRTVVNQAPAFGREFHIKVQILVLSNNQTLSTVKSPLPNGNIQQLPLQTSVMGGAGQRGESDVSSMSHRGWLLGSPL